MLKISYKLTCALTGVAAITGGLSWTPPARAADPFIAEIVMFGGNFAPRGWALCDGQLLAINQYQALFSLLGTTYGGDGRTNFALPDLRGRTAVHPGTGPGLSAIQLGQRGGAEQHTLAMAQMPSHSHSADTTVDSFFDITLWGNANRGNSNAPGGNSLAAPRAKGQKIYQTQAPNVQLHPDSIQVSATGGGATTTIGNTGGGQPFSIRDPYLGINHIIALQGVFPSRN